MAIRQAEKMDLLISDEIKKEMLTVARTFESEKTFSLVQRREFRRLIKSVLNLAEVVNIPGRLKICRDPADDIYLETCQKGQAHYLVSGDKDLLEVDPALMKKARLGGLRILSPTRFLKELGVTD